MTTFTRNILLINFYDIDHFYSQATIISESPGDPLQLDLDPNKLSRRFP